MQDTLTKVRLLAQFACRGLYFILFVMLFRAVPGMCIALLLTFLSTWVPAQAEQMSWLENDEVRLGVDLDRGGAITFLASVKDGENVINNFDLGRQVQLSFYSGPVPFEVNGQKPKEHWKHLGWNPIQSGDDYNNKSKVLAHENDGRVLHVKCRPLQWPLNKVEGECTFDSWLELDGPVVKGRARLTNARTDKTQYPARLQELPAVYANAPFHRVISYVGDRPFTGGDVTRIPQAAGKHPWSFWPATEGWSAMLNEDNYGLGLISPGRINFTGGFVGKPGPNDTHAASTGYLASQSLEVLDSNIEFEFRYELVLGTLAQIRARAAEHRPTGLPDWSFRQDRQGWGYVHATDAGWPVHGQVELRLDQDDPHMMSPLTLWQAAEAPYLILEAAFQTHQKQAVVMWQRLGETNFSAQAMTAFPVKGDGQFRPYVIHLGAVESYAGAMQRLRLDPVGAGEAGARVQVRRIRLVEKRPD